MRNLKRLLAIGLVVLVMAAFIPVSALAANQYTYTVRIYAGAQGLIDGTQEVIVYTGLKYGERVDFNINRVALSDDSGKYYVRGIRESGRDNNTVAAPSIYVTSDVDYVVAYGILGSAVAYTVYYQDQAGNDLYPSITYYGNVGDKPVVAYQYIEGYQPQAYNITQTLSANAADNVFTFIYTPLPQPGEDVVVIPGPGGAPAGPGGEENPAGPGGEENPAGPVENIPDANTPDANPQEPQNIQDNDVPMAGPGSNGGNDGNSGNGGSGSDRHNVDMSGEGAKGLGTGAKVAIGGGAAATAGLIGWLMFYIKRKKDKNEEA